MFVLVTYDVEDDRLRTRIADTLEGYGQRVQYSVFECRLSAAQYAELIDALERLLDRTSEEEASMVSIRCYRLCRNCTRRINILGAGSITQDPGYYLV